MIAKSISGKSCEEIKTTLDKVMADGYTPTLAIVFISIKQNTEAVCEILQKENIDIIGATSCYEFVDSHQSEGEIALLLLNIHKEDYNILFEALGENTLEETATKLAQSALQQFSNG